MIGRQPLFPSWPDLRLKQEPNGSVQTTAPRLSDLPPRPLLTQQPEQHVVLPLAVDAEVFAGVAFLAEAAAREQVPARAVVGQACRLDAVQVQAVEGEAQHQPERLFHEAAAGIALAHPIAEA